MRETREIIDGHRTLHAAPIDYHAALLDSDLRPYHEARKRAEIHVDNVVTSPRPKTASKPKQNTQSKLSGDFSASIDFENFMPSGANFGRPKTPYLPKNSLLEVTATWETKLEFSTCWRSQGWVCADARPPRPEKTLVVTLLKLMALLRPAGDSDAGICINDHRNRYLGEPGLRTFWVLPQFAFSYNSLYSPSNTTVAPEARLTTAAGRYVLPSSPTRTPGLQTKDSHCA